MEDPRAALNYAIDVIKGRWHEAEPVILADRGWGAEYRKRFMQEEV